MRTALFAEMLTMLGESTTATHEAGCKHDATMTRCGEFLPSFFLGSKALPAVLPRFIRISGVGLGMALALASCASPPEHVGPTDVMVGWFVRCNALDGSSIPGCSETPARYVGGSVPVSPDDPAGTQLGCTVDESSSTRAVTIDMSAGVGAEEQRIALSRVVVPRPGGLVSGECTFTFVDGGETFSAPCGAERPSAAQPCQVMVAFNTAASFDDLQTFLYVECVEARSASGTRRSLIGFGADARDVPQLAGFMFGCPPSR